jgi:hypothetical protein
VVWMFICCRYRRIVGKQTNSTLPISVHYISLLFYWSKWKLFQIKFAESDFVHISLYVPTFVSCLSSYQQNTGGTR